ncbi:uncharacterized protein V6R79_025447 [Siganus canaliculatus]
MAMKLIPVHLIFGCILVLIHISQCETDFKTQHICQEHKTGGDQKVDSSVPENELEHIWLESNKLLCLLYPTNELNCSWSLHNLDEDSHLFVHISICDDGEAVDSLSQSYSSRAGSMGRTLTLEQYDELHVVFQMNVTLHDLWAVHTFTYDTNLLEVLPPPQNISASIKNGDLVVTWDPPASREDLTHDCFEYQLDLGDQEQLRNLSNQQSYTQSNADQPTYRVTLRTRKDETCQDDPQWSAWSHPVTVEQSLSNLNIRVIILISIGIPMILLAGLLLVRSQRLAEVLFPPIPRPPTKYITFLEKSETFDFFHPAPVPEPVEEITEVEDTEQNPGRTL